MKITGISISNYAGIVAMEAVVPEHGLLLKGGNGRGKTTVLNALKAALEGKGIDAAAIHNGADVAEVRVELVNGSIAHTARRRISAKGASTIEVSAGDMNANKPAAFLATLLGATLDPLEIATVDAKKRRSLVLSALPVAVTLEQLRAWVPSIGQVDTAGHGLEVVERLRKAYFEQRTEARRALKPLEGEASRAIGAARDLAASAPRQAPTIAAAQRELDAAQATVAQLDAQNAEAAKAVERSGAAVARVDALHKEAAKFAANAEASRPSGDELAAARQTVAEAREMVADLERELASAKAGHMMACGALASLENAVKGADEHERLAAERRRSARELAEAVGAVSVAPVTPARLEAAHVLLDAAVAQRRDAELAAAAADAAARATKATDALTAARLRESELDAAVEALTTTAPRALIDAATGIPGLSIVDDDIALDGVKWASLSTSEQMRLALDVARRVSRSNIFFVDKLESIDEERREDFVRLATAGGGQLFATLVTRGELQLVAVEPTDVAQAAE